MKKILDYFFAARPLLQLPIWTVYLVSLHYSRESSMGRFGWPDLLIMLGISLLFTGAAYLNQVYDIESDRINRKVGFLQRGFLRPSQLTTGFAVVSIIPMAIAPFVSLLTLIIFAQFLLLSYFYSAPPLRLKDRPIGGLFANAYGHGLLVAIAVAFNLGLSDLDRLRWDIPVYFFLTVAAAHCLTTIPDRGGDAASGKHTLAVVLPRHGVLLVALILIAFSVVVALLRDYELLASLSIVAGVLALAALFLRIDAAVRFAAKMPLLLLTLVAGYFYPVYLAFVVALLIATRAYYLKRFGVVYPELA